MTLLGAEGGDKTNDRQTAVRRTDVCLPLAPQLRPQTCSQYLTSLSYESSTEQQPELILTAT